MKTRYQCIALLTAALLAATTTAQRQVFFTESMGEAPKAEPYPTVVQWKGWHNPGLTVTAIEGMNLPDVRPTVVSAAATPPYLEGSGSNNIYFMAETPGTNRGFDMKGINALQYKNIQLSFGYSKTLAEVPSDLNLYYWNGTEWKPLTFRFNETTEPSGWYRSPAIDLPADAAHADLGFRFVRPETSTNSIRIDDIWLTGEPLIAAPPVVHNASDIQPTGFTLSWEPYANAVGYLIDLSESPTFSSAAEPVTLAAWTFPTAYEPGSTPKPHLFSDNNKDKTLSCTATGNDANPAPYPAGDGSETNPFAMNSTGWEDGVYKKYYRIDLNTVGFYGLTLSSANFSTANGPKHMKVQYRLNDTEEWFDVPNSDLLMPEAAYAATSVLTNLPLPSACDNQANVSIRWVVTASWRTSGKSAYIVTSGGASRITGIVVKGMPAAAANGYLGLPVTGTSHAVIALEPNKTYYYRVSATDGVRVSNASEVRQVKTPLPGAADWTKPDAATVCYNRLGGTFEIQTPQPIGCGLVQVADVHGRICLRTSLSGTNASIHAAHLPAGVYLLTLTHDGLTHHFKCCKP